MPHLRADSCRRRERLLPVLDASARKRSQKGIYYLRAHTGRTLGDLTGRWTPGGQSSGLKFASTGQRPSPEPINVAIYAGSGNVNID